MSEKKESCSESVHNGFGVSFHPCRKAATVVRDGKPFCATHDPERVKARRDKATAKWEYESALRMAEREIQRARNEAADVVERGDFSQLALESARHNIVRAQQKLAELEVRAHPSEQAP